MKELRFVDVGEGITEGHIKKWLVKDGDMVKEDQTILQIETDKAVVDMPAPLTGKIKIAAQENTTVKVGDLLAYIGEGPSEGAGAQQAGKAAAEQTAPKAQEAHAATEEILATPAVRKLARDLGMDIKGLHGTGPHGRILENDVRTASGPAQKKAAIQKFSELKEEQHGEEITRVPMSQTRKAIARNMELSWTIPRAVHMDKLNATKLFGIVQREKAKLAELGIKLTFLPFIIKATVDALKEFPHFNASYDHEKLEIIVKRYYNIGIAVEAPDGLKVVVMKNADKKGIAEIAAELGRLGEKARNLTITLDEMSDSTFTITNIGSLGGGYLSVPMINYPEVAILGIHSIRDEAVVENNEIKAAKVLPFSLAFDHRVVDGAEAVAFGNALIKYLEDPDLLEIVG